MVSKETDATYDLIEQEAQRDLIGNRTATTALLAWFLETVWRLDPEEVSDAICDGGGDKGIDALSVDSLQKEIVIFQAKHRNTSVVTQGDKELKAFVGVAAYFSNSTALDGLLDSKPNEELRKLLVRHDIKGLLTARDFSVRLVFVTNASLDASGTGYSSARANQTPILDVWDRKRLAGLAERTKSLVPLDEAVTLKASSGGVIVEDLGEGTKLALALISGPDLVRLPGIDDLSVFALNVRLGIGKTRINKELATTITDKKEHALFPAYHNGLTLLTRQMRIDDDEIKLNGVSVVNGCQSLLALYRDRASITPSLRLLVKIVQLGSALELADEITYRTNNQNPVTVRDQRSTDGTQRDLQAQVRTFYGNELGYLIRLGEKMNTIEVIENSQAAQLIMAIWVKQPWNAVRKVRLFDEDYYSVFNRTIDGHKIYLANIFKNVVESHRDKLRKDLNASFASVKFTIAHLLAEVVRLTPDGAEFLENPGRWLPGKKKQVITVLNEIVEEVVASVNFYVEEKEQEDLKDAAAPFDPKVVFKSQAGIRPLQHEVIQQSRRALKRSKEYGFKVKAVT